MDYKKIETAFENRIAHAEGYSMPSAVLVPIMYLYDEPHLLLTKRALHMKHQPGDFCFPGGHGEGNEQPIETALRETREELGVPHENIKILGPCDFIISPFGAYVKPFIGIIENFDTDDFTLNPDEVEKILLVPLDFFMETEPRLSIITLEQKFPPDFPFHLIVGGKNYKWSNCKNKQWFYDYDGNIIWGLTARIINNVKAILNNPH